MNKLPLLFRIILAVAMWLLLSALIYNFTQDVAAGFILSFFITWFTFVIDYLICEAKDEKNKDESTYDYTFIDLGTCTMVIEDKEDETEEQK